MRSDQDLKVRTKALLRQVRPLGAGPVEIRGASESDLHRFEREFDVRLPAELSEWLRHCDGAAVNPGGLYGLFSRQSGECNVDWYWREFPRWRERGWYPIASDGCGDVYVLTTEITTPGTGTHPVFFLDQADWEKPAYLVGSGLWEFLYFLLESEVLHDDGQRASWPFDRDAVLAVDPALAACRGIQLPWDVETGTFFD